MENHTRPKRSAMSKVNTLDLIAEALRAHPDCLEVTAIPHAREEDQKIRLRAPPPPTPLLLKGIVSRDQ
jgi:hypothetical protein